jgi:hypothetical protein
MQWRKWPTLAVDGEIGKMANIRHHTGLAKDGEIKVFLPILLLSW